VSRVDREEVTANGVTIWTDGSIYYRHTIRPGGWAFVVANQGQEVHRESGVELLTTSNRMEMVAVIRALQSVGDFAGGGPAYLYSDSQYVVRGATEWLMTWKRNGWQKSTGGLVSNRDLWEELDAAWVQVNVRIGWVRGHVGVEFNELADELAGIESKGAQEAWRTSRMGI